MANSGFRAWYYFRMGWSTYFAFIFAAINTLTVTYFLAIDKYPILKDIFPNFIVYVAIITVIGIPLLVGIGYAHYKRTKAFRSEVDILVESNPYTSRVLANSEMMLKLSLSLNKVVLKLAKNEKITDDEIAEITKLQTEFSTLSSERTFSNRKDVEFLRKDAGI